MKHPIVLIIPVLMLCDYFLTIIGNILRERSYSNHVKIQQYELNPTFQSSVKERKWFNVRHLISTALVTLFVIYVSQDTDDIPAGIKMCLFGMLVVLFSAVIGRHLTNILIFRYSIKHPDEISGELQFSHKMVLKISQYEIMVALFPFLMVAMFVQIPFIIGGLLGLLLFWLMHSDWLRKHEKREKQESNSKQAIQSMSGAKKTVLSHITRVIFNILGCFAIVVIALLSTGFCSYRHLYTVLFLIVPGSVFAATVISILFIPSRFRVLTILAATCVVVGGVAVYESTLPTYDELKVEGQRIIGAAEQYRMEHGQYPSSLEEIDINGLTTNYGGWIYEVSEDGQVLFLTIGDYGQDVFELLWTSESCEWHLDT